ncbi:YjbQ family protein [Paracoccus aurantiacus]|uniref:YjbQ family protein n=1 Tax=Paracoccus aurantiacus TaxID=2599412 RepID=A0A5C6S845_9RHOB|nr:secondary thiamine-phosphate synthase enzyme YjbQ [Paracoccus aurantiacus]TXB70687.1 YjbQ family protein [Paracoccus aurantiacus]
MIGSISVQTRGPGFYEITRALQEQVEGQGDGVLTAMIRHSSASLLIQENADPDVRRDLLEWLDRLAPRADHPSMAWVTHRLEGPDDMPAHMKASVLPVSVQISVSDGRMMLGRWQGIYVVEHRDAPHRREVALAFTPA